MAFRKVRFRNPLSFGKKPSFSSLRLTAYRTGHRGAIMSWGAGPALGLLTFCGYLLSLFGVAVVWRNRNSFLVWVQDEISFFHRSFSRFTAEGPFYIPRSDSTRFKEVPHYVVNSLARLARNRINGGALLLFVGLLLFLLDFYV